MTPGAPGRCPGTGPGHWPGGGLVEGLSPRGSHGLEGNVGRRGAQVERGVHVEAVVVAGVGVAGGGVVAVVGRRVDRVVAVVHGVVAVVDGGVDTVVDRVVAVVDAVVHRVIAVVHGGVAAVADRVVGGGGLGGLVAGHLHRARVAVDADVARVGFAALAEGHRAAVG